MFTCLEPHPGPATLGERGEGGKVGRGRKGSHMTKAGALVILFSLGEP